MFEPLAHPRVFRLPPGIDFARQVVLGLRERTAGDEPNAICRVRLIVNSSRMAREIKAAFVETGSGFLPRIELVTQLPDLFPEFDPGPSAPALHRKLDLAQLVAAVLETRAVRAPRSALFDLTESLQTIFAEMQSEGVSVETLRSLDVQDSAQHWQTALAFLSLAAEFHEADPSADADGRLRQFAERATAAWVSDPPLDPIIVAGSTGSRGATRLLMERIARLPQGALILPGFDDTAPLEVWTDLQGPEASEDHPQYRYASLLQSLDLSTNQVDAWRTVEAPSPERNKLLSLALRPAPVTDRWITEGQKYSDLPSHLAGLSLIEAPSPRAEATAIACRIRAAVNEEKSVALITPDRMLTRRVAAALSRWRITPDDSAGQPLHLSASGQFLRLLAPRGDRPLTARELLTLLKSPICNSAPQWRGPHLRHTRDLELFIRQNRVAYPKDTDLAVWAGGDGERTAWANWLSSCLARLSGPGRATLAQHVAAHMDRLAALSDGQGEDGAGQVWKHEPGELARAVMDRLADAGERGGPMGATDYGTLVQSLLQAETVRRSEAVHSNVKILGTLEARVGTADVMILGGLNEGSWPEPSRPDPWLSRKMRNDAGLTLPERQIGLAAHDFQQAAGAAEVVLSRAVQSGEAPTIASRWLSRLTNLVSGLKKAEGPAALNEMKDRGEVWLSLAKKIETAEPMPKAGRPAPIVPVEKRPKRFSVTQIETLIRDPYAIYASHVLGLRPLNPLTMKPDAPLKGTALHRVYEQFVKEGLPDDHEAAKHRLVEIASKVFEEEAPWPAVRGNWLARVAGNADWFVATEALRQSKGEPIAFEVRGQINLTKPDIALVGKADRIDRVAEEIKFYDYKSGSLPNAAEQASFNKQLPLEIAMANAGGFETIPPGFRSFSAAFIGLGSSPEVKEANLEDKDPEAILAEFTCLMEAWQAQDLGYVSRRYPHSDDRHADYEHLARFGEWSDGDTPQSQDLT